MGTSYYNVWTNDPFIYKSTTSGVNVYDLGGDSLSILGFIDYENTSGVWADDNYVYIATSVSGIYRCDVSTVTGTVTLTPYKQYPEITSNYVYCIHGCGDYLCATTESGVDHYNLTTGSGIYTTLSGVGKCFQTARGEFYYIYNQPETNRDELHVVYDNINNWGIDTVGGIYTLEKSEVYEESIDGWLETWSKRTELTVDNTNVDTTLSDFPVLLKLSDSSGISSADVTSVFTELGSDANRKKIAVTTSDGTTQCYMEIERFDYANSAAWLWVKAPTVDSGTVTSFYLYYDSSKSDNITYVGDTVATPAQNVWDDSFKLVMHMSQDPNGDVTGSIKDSTSNANHGNPAGSMTTADLVDGKIGKAIDFDTNDTLTNPNITFTGPFSVEWIIKPDSLLNWNQTLGGTASWGTFIAHTETGGGLYVGTDIATRFTPTNTGGGVYSVGGYTNMVYTYDGTNGRLYKNGVVLCGPTVQTTPTAWGGFSLRTHDGIEDEIRISDTPRSAAWIKATYYSNWDGLVSFGAEEEFTAVSELIVTVNDLHVTEKTSRYNSGNVMFLASTGGVTVIEEKPGDEENSNYKYYYINT